jgi:hypothetical protein
VTLPQLLGQPDEDALGAADVAPAVEVLVLDDLPDQLGAMGAQPPEDVVEVVDREHDAADPQGGHGRVPRHARERRRRVELVQLDPAMPVGR